jgi:Rrf2 family protein
MRISARVDLAVRTMVELARTEPGGLRRGAELAEIQDAPPTTLEDVLSGLRRAGLVVSQRGPSGGWRLSRPADEITVADIIRGLEGSLTYVRGIRPDELEIAPDAVAMQHMWVALRVQVRTVLEHVTLDDLAANRLDPAIEALCDNDDAWRTRDLRGTPGSLNVPGNALP